MSRILVTGVYTSKNTYTLIKEDGSLYKTITVGEPFRIDNQLRQWVPELAQKKSGHGTIIVCRKYRGNGDLHEEFPLIHNKRMLWATSSGSARRGVWHTYREPQTDLEKVLAEFGIGRSVVTEVDTIDHVFEIGGHLCSHTVKKWGYKLFSDGEEAADTMSLPVPVVTEHSNQYHVGCIDGTYPYHLVGGTYAIYVSIGTHMNGATYGSVMEILLTPYGENDAIEELKMLRENRVI